MEENDQKKPKIDTYIQIIGIILAALGLVVTLIFSIKSDKEKELTITYESKRSLLISDNSKTAASLEVSVLGNRVMAPWILSGRLENTGTIPIEERDIEQPIQIDFGKSKIINADVVQKNQDSLFAKINTNTNSIEVIHKLLNPGDWVSFDIVLDGEPNIPPNSTLRISGVSELKSSLLQTGQQKTYPTLFEMPKSIVYSLLTITTAIGIMLVLAGPAAALSSIRNNQAIQRAQNTRTEFKPSINEKIEHLQQKSLIIYGIIRQEINTEEFDYIDRIKNAIKNEIPDDLLLKLNLNTESAAKIIQNDIKKSVKESLISEGYMYLPTGINSIYMEKIRSIDASNSTIREMVEISKQTVKDLLEKNKESSTKNIDYSPIFAGAIIVAIGLAITLIAGGTWRTLLWP